MRGVAPTGTAANTAAATDPVVSDSGTAMSRGVKISAVITLLVLSSLLALSAFLSAGSTVLFPRREGRGDPIRRAVLPLFPESWPFFTKPPDDIELTAYRVADGVAETLGTFPNASSANYYGLSRTQRAEGPELANLANRVPESSWTDCAAVTEDCVVAATQRPSLQVYNSSVVPVVCGPVVLSQTKPVPWQFRHDYDGWRLDESVIFVDALCGE